MLRPSMLHGKKLPKPHFQVLSHEASLSTQLTASALQGCNRGVARAPGLATLHPAAKNST